MLKSKFFTISMVITVVFLGLAFIRAQQPINDFKAELNHTNQKLTEAKRNNEDLAREASNSYNESYIERQLRLRLNYKKSDEKAVLIYKTEPTIKELQQSPFLAEHYHKFLNWLKSFFDK